MDEKDFAATDNFFSQDDFFPQDNFFSQGERSDLSRFPTLERVSDKEQAPAEERAPVVEQVPVSAEPVSREEGREPEAADRWESLNDLDASPQRKNGSAEGKNRNLPRSILYAVLVVVGYKVFGVLPALLGTGVGALLHKQLEKKYPGQLLPTVVSIVAGLAAAIVISVGMGVLLTQLN